MVKRTPAHHGLSTTGLLFYNALLSLPLLAVSLAASPEPARILAFPSLGSPSLQVHLAASIDESSYCSAVCCSSACLRWLPSLSRLASWHFPALDHLDCR